MVDVKHQEEAFARGMFYIVGRCGEGPSDKGAAFQVELALHLDSMTALLKLIYIAPRASTVVPCVSWLSLNLVRIPLRPFVVYSPHVI